MCQEKENCYPTWLGSSSIKENLSFICTTTKQLSEPPIEVFFHITATRAFPLTTTPTDNPVLSSFDQPPIENTTN